MKYDNAFIKKEELEHWLCDVLKSLYSIVNILSAVTPVIH